MAADPCEWEVRGAEWTTPSDPRAPSEEWVQGQEKAEPETARTEAKPLVATTIHRKERMEGEKQGGFAVVNWTAPQAGGRVVEQVQRG